MSDDREEDADRDDESAATDADPFEIIDDSGTGDPFERLDAGDRDTDPFEHIGDRERSAAEDAGADPFGADAGRDGSSESDAPPDAGSFDESGADAESGDEPNGEPVSSDAASPGTPATGEEDDPFAGLGRDRRTGDPFDGLSVDSAGAAESGRPDADLWEELSRSEVEPETETHGQRRFAEVSKHTYCERCEYFSEPPDISCAHDGTDIIEFVDFERVRVADCPIVAQRERLADLDGEQ